MFQKTLLAFLGLALCTSIAAEECQKCERSECATVSFCPSGVTLDSCGCCEVCSQRLGQKCDYVMLDSTVHGNCGDFLSCSEEGVCECEEEGSVCGSDEVTYNSICELMEATVLDNELTLIDRAPCRIGPVIKSPPKDAARPVGSILVLDCEASGFPVPSITWEFYHPDGSSIPLPNDNSLVAVQVRGGPEKHMATGWVQIMKILPENIGIYTCVATNPNGQAKASAKITISKGKVPKKKY